MLRDCGAPWKTVIITYDAQVLPCCFSTQRGDREKTIQIASYGSLLDNKFVDIWNNKKYKILRKNIKENKPYAICTNCALICNGKQE